MKAIGPVALVVALLAGCADPADPGPQPVEGDGAPTVTTPSAPAAPASVELVTPFTWAGHTKEGAWVCTEQDGASQCLAGQQVAPDGQHRMVLAYAGDLTALDLTMTWQADPTQTGLVLAVYMNGTTTPVALGHGDSPLRVQLDAAGLGLQPDDALVLIVWAEGKTPTSPSVFVDVTQQPFSVEGTLTSEVPAGR